MTALGDSGRSDLADQLEKENQDFQQTNNPNEGEEQATEQTAE